MVASLWSSAPTRRGMLVWPVVTSLLAIAAGEPAPRPSQPLQHERTNIFNKVPASAASPTALPASRLSVEHQRSPSVVDTPNPRFAWHVAASAGVRGASQVAFRVQVCGVISHGGGNGGGGWGCDPDCAASPGPAASGPRCAWDSGRVDSGAHWGVQYGSTRLGADPASEFGGAADTGPPGLRLPSDSSFGWRVKWWARTAANSSRAADPPPLEAGWSAVARMDTAFIGGVYDTMA